MLLAVLQMQLQIFYFHTYKIKYSLYMRHYLFQMLDLKILVQLVHVQIPYVKRQKNVSQQVPLVLDIPISHKSEQII
jgi:hypothetical protein